MGQAGESAFSGRHTIIYGSFPARHSEESVLGTTHHGYNPTP